MVTLYFPGKEDQKNWSPFLYNESKVLMIQSINPLKIVDFVAIDTPERGVANFFSSTPEAHIPYKFGHLRGGTNAVFLGDKYLAFFHSAFTLPGNTMKTYLMGAYTFTAHPPFRLLTMSPEPILDRFLYEGEWAPFKNRKNDYVIFPSALILMKKGQVDVAQEELLLSFGRQDYQGWVARIELKRLLDSMVPVVYCDTDQDHELRAIYNCS